MKTVTFEVVCSDVSKIIAPSRSYDYLRYLIDRGGAKSPYVNLVTDTWGSVSNQNTASIVKQMICKGRKDLTPELICVRAALTRVQVSCGEVLSKLEEAQELLSTNPEFLQRKLEDTLGMESSSKDQWYELGSIRYFSPSHVCYYAGRKEGWKGFV